MRERVHCLWRKHNKCESFNPGYLYAIDVRCSYKGIESDDKGMSLTLSYPDGLLHLECWPVQHSRFKIQDINLDNLKKGIFDVSIVIKTAEE